MPVTHVVPNRDAKDHQVFKDGFCWCKPQVQEESETDRTYIHRPQKAVVPGHTLDIQKILIDETTGDVMTPKVPR